MRKKRNLTNDDNTLTTSDLIGLSLRVAKLPPIDNTNAEQLAARADEYFQMREAYVERNRQRDGAGQAQTVGNANGCSRKRNVI